MARRRRRSNTGIPGLSFSWKRALGVTRARQRFARATGIPTTRSGMQRKMGRMLLGGGSRRRARSASTGCGCLLAALAALLAFLIAATGCAPPLVGLAPSAVAPMLLASPAEMATASSASLPTTLTTELAMATPTPAHSPTATPAPTHTATPTATAPPAPTETPPPTETPLPSATPTLTPVPATPTLPVTDECLYLGNRSSQVFHWPGCSSVRQMAEHNKVCLLSREDALDHGYRPCGRCKP